MAIMQRLCLLLPLGSALLAPISPAARSIAVRPNSYLDDLPAAAATKPAPAPAAAPAPVAEKDWFYRLLAGDLGASGVRSPPAWPSLD